MSDLLRRQIYETAPDLVGWRSWPRIAKPGHFGRAPVARTGFGGGGGRWGRGGGKTGAAQSGERLRKGHLPVIWKQGWSERRGEEEAVILTLKDNTSAPGLVDSLCNFITPQSLPLSHTNTHTHTRRLLQDGSIKLNTINSVPLCASASLN